jgi:hypothetical protein
VPASNGANHGKREQIQRCGQVRMQKADVIFDKRGLNQQGAWRPKMKKALSAPLMMPTEPVF